MTPLKPENNLKELGWDNHFATSYESLKIPNAVPGRVISVAKESCQVLTESGELFATVSGKMRFNIANSEQYPAVGDWVAVQPVNSELKGIIHAVLPRKSKFSRHASGGRERIAGGKTEEQIVAANVDTVFLVSALDIERNTNLRRLERYIAIAVNSRAAPVIVLNKADLCDDVASIIREVETVAGGIPVCAVSAITGNGLDILQSYLKTGITAALLGQSGVGKSAIINALLGEERLAVGAVRSSDLRGRHTTTQRQLVRLPGSGMIIDSPGLREIQVWGDESNLDNTFEDIAEIAANCRFKDCQHYSEPGCAVQAAIASGELDADRLKSYRRLQRELSYLAARQKGLVALEEKKRWKQISQFQKQFQKKGKNFL